MRMLEYEGTKSMELREFASILTKHWVFILAMSLVGLSGAAGVSIVMTPKFESRTQIYVSVNSGVGNSSDLLQGANYSRQIVNSYVDVIKSGVVLAPVVEQLELELSATELSRHISVVSPNDTALINITVASSSAERSAEIAAAVGESFKEVVRTQLDPETDTGQNMVSLTTTQEALVPLKHVSPRVPLYLIIGLVLGLFAGIGIAVLRSLLDTRIHSIRDVEDATGAPILGGIVDDSHASKNPLTVQTRPMSPRAESFRALRTNLQFLNVDSDSSIMVVTSANPAEGKSTTVANLALALEQSGSRVVLIEADLRAPKVHEYLGVESAAGLTDVLIGKVELDDVLQRWGRTQMHFLPAGSIPPNPSELLGSEGMKSLLDRLDEEFDYVLIDASPLLAVTDATVVGQGKAGIILIAASARTTKPQLAAAVNVLENAGSNLLGVVVTMLQAKSGGNYGYGYYSYGYGSEEQLSMGEVKSDD